MGVVSHSRVMGLARPHEGPTDLTARQAVVGGQVLEVRPDSFLFNKVHGHKGII